MLRTTFSVESFGSSDIGLVRDHNEDVFRILKEKKVFIVADGMGGHSAGEVAAELAVETLSDLLNKGVELKRAFELVNTAVYKKAGSDSSLTGMGTTLVCLQMIEGSAHIAHVGDSRVYRMRKKQLEPLTLDHTLIAELTAEGIMKKEEAKSFPYRHILTRAIGTNPNQAPTLLQTDIADLDLYLLCSDGLTNFCSEEEIAKILESGISVEMMAKQLIESAKKNGGGDNITVIVLRIVA